MKQTEKKCQNDVIKYYKAKGYQILKTMGGFQGSYSTPEGGPDLIVFGVNAYGESFTYFIEVKSETGKLRDSQIVKAYKLIQMGFTYGVARPFEMKPYFKVEGNQREAALFNSITEQDYIKAKANLEKAKAEKKALREHTKLLKETHNLLKLKDEITACNYKLCLNEATGILFDKAFCDQHTKLAVKNDYKVLKKSMEGDLK